MDYDFHPSIVVGDLVYSVYFSFILILLYTVNSVQYAVSISRMRFGLLLSCVRENQIPNYLA